LEEKKYARENPETCPEAHHGVVLIGGLALGKMCADLARFIVANEGGVRFLSS